MQFSNFEQAQKILVYGFGVEGQSTLRFLKNRFPKAIVQVYDDNLAIHMPDFKTYPLEEYDIVVVSPGISRQSFSWGVRQKCTSQVEIFLDNLSEDKRKKLIGISGTKGKSTTTKFCFEMLQLAGKKVAIGGNYGVPILDLYDDFMNGAYEYIVAELSSYQLEYVKRSPGIGIFLNVYPEHLDRHGGYAEYIQAKTNLWRYQKDSDWMLVPRKMKALIEEIKTHNIFITDPMPEEYFPKHSIFRALHFRENFGTCILLAHLLDIDDAIIQKTTYDFKGLSHRLEFVTKRHDIFFYNDSISTNPHSTYSALQFFKDRIGTLIIGGKDRGIDYTLLYHAIEKFCPRAFILVLDTETRAKIVQVFHNNDFQNYTVVKNLSEAVKIAYEKTPKSKVCLLSPAASSFDTFQNYIERGNVFKKCVLGVR